MRWLENCGNVLHQRLFVCKQFSFHYAHHRALSVMPFSLTAQAPFLTLLRSNPHSGCNSGESSSIESSGSRSCDKPRDNKTKLKKPWSSEEYEFCWYNAWCNWSMYPLGHNPCAGEGVEE
jgi:hypothetical protein